MPEILADRFIMIDGVAARQGGQSVVRKAFDLSLQCQVAVKLFSTRSDDLTRKIFQREISTLQSLDHPNIVKIILSGEDETGTPFMVLKWIERDLRSVIESGAHSWQTVIDTYVKPLTSALAHAHAKGIEHRDIKPGNILVGEQGELLLADFGIGKIRHDLPTDMTLAAFKSGVYAPPDSGSIPYVRDVYSLGVLFVRLMTEGELTEYHQVERALDEMDLPSNVKSVFARCLASDPGMRPANALVLLQQLDELSQGDRQNELRNQTRITLRLTAAARRQLEEDGVYNSQAGDFVVADIGRTPAVEYRLDRQTLRHDRGTIFLTSDSRRYTLKRDESGSALVVTSSKAEEFEALEACRRRSLQVEGWLTWLVDRAPDSTSARAIDVLLQSLDTHYADIEEEKASGADGNRNDQLEIWQRLLEAREQLARGDQGPLVFTSSQQNGREIDIELRETVEDDLVGSEWEIRAPGARSAVTRGEVIHHSGSQIRMLGRGRERRIPRSGELVPHLGPARIGLQRQHDALNTLRTRTGTFAKLAEILDQPGQAEPPIPYMVSDWQQKLDADKQRAVEAALGNRNILLVKGPPGTGKTTFITELVSQFLRKTPNARVLIVSQTHVAVDNALERLVKAGLEAMVRLGDGDDPRISPSVHHLLLDRRMSVWATELQESAENHMRSLAQEAGIDHQHLKAALLLQQYASARSEAELVADQLLAFMLDDSPSQVATGLEISSDRTALQDRIERLENRASGYLTSAQAILSDSLTLNDDLAVEDARAAADLLVSEKRPGRSLIELLRLQGEWLARVASDQNLAASYLQTTRVIAGTCLGFLRHPAVRSLNIDLCILDEASKATATEALVPLVRAKFGVLVGDLNQLPPQDEDLLRRGDLLRDHGLTADTVRETLFQRLSDHLPSENQYALLEQYRMVRPIGDLVSACFYSGSLRSPQTNGLRGYSLLGKEVLWLDTESLGPRRFEDASGGAERTYTNRTEAQIVLDRLVSINNALSGQLIHPPDTGKPLEVLLIAPYRGQVAELRRRLGSAKLDHLDVEVQTVDAVQGRECDLAIFSVTRSNADRRMGFLGKDYWRRINVALSRARFGLTVVGSAAFCKSSPGALRDVLSYMEENPADCEIRAVTQVGR